MSYTIALSDILYVHKIVCYISIYMYIYFKGALKEKLRIYGTSHLELLTRLALVVYFLGMFYVQGIYLHYTIYSFMVYFASYSNTYTTPLYALEKLYEPNYVSKC